MSRVIRSIVERESQSKPEKAKRKILRRVVPLAAAGLVIGTIGTCEVAATDFNHRHGSLPCHELNLPDVPGATELEEGLCLSIAGEQPQRIGVERTLLPGGRFANTLWLEWNYDGATEFARQHKPDAEPITLITDSSGAPLATQVRSHWIIGSYAFDTEGYGRGSDHEEVCSFGHIRVAVTNAFHTPVVAGGNGEVLDPQEKGGINRFIYRTVSRYAMAVGDFFRSSLRPLRATGQNEIPDAEHPARSQPVFHVE
ncbi:MAG: hypothetical protein ABIH29_02370 [Candidatus Micrarchaeota archaeon]